MDRLAKRISYAAGISTIVCCLFNVGFFCSFFFKIVIGIKRQWIIPIWIFFNFCYALFLVVIGALGSPAIVDKIALTLLKIGFAIGRREQAKFNKVPIAQQRQLYLAGQLKTPVLAKLSIWMIKLSVDNPFVTKRFSYTGAGLFPKIN